MNPRAWTARSRLPRCLRNYLLLIILNVMEIADSPASAGNSANTLLTLIDGRPVAEGVQQLVSRYGYVITYEDPRYAYKGDLEDVTDQVRRDGRHYPRVVVPQTFTLSLSIPNEAPFDSREVHTLLDRLLQAARNAGRGGHFDVVQVGDVFHVVPTEVRDTHGNWIGQVSILDTPISLPVADRSEDGLLAAICDATSMAALTKISMGGQVGGIYSPSNLTPYRMGAEAEKARDVLMKAFALIQDSKSGRWATERMTWLLFYDPIDGQYVLNLNSVKPGPVGVTVR